MSLSCGHALHCFLSERPMRKRAQVLIVEDEAVFALELSGIVISGGGQVIGPCHSLAEAMHVLDMVPDVDVALLGSRLQDREMTVLAHRLFNASVPIVMHTALPLPTDLLGRIQNISICAKPATPWKNLAGYRDSLLACAEEKTADEMLDSGGAWMAPRRSRKRVGRAATHHH